MLDLSAYKLNGWNAEVFSVVYENKSLRLKFIFPGYFEYK